MCIRDRFDSGRYSLELQENRLKLQLRIAEILAEEYVPLVREAVKEVKNVYLPDGNRELLEAAAVFYGCLLYTSFNPVLWLHQGRAEIIIDAVVLKAILQIAHRTFAGLFKCFVYGDRINRFFHAITKSLFLFL